MRAPFDLLADELPWAPTVLANLTPALLHGIAARLERAPERLDRRRPAVALGRRRRARCSRRCARSTAPTEGEWAAVLLGRDDPPRDPRRARPGRARARRAGRARARRPGGARHRRRHRRVRDLRRAGRAARRCPTCARPPAARSWTSRPPSSPTTGTSAGAPGTRPSWSRPAAGRCACARRGRRPQPGTIDVAIEPGAGVRHRRARDDAAVARRC